MPTDQKPPVSRRKLGLAGIVGICVAATIVVTGIVGRAKTDENLKTWTDDQAIPTVAVAPPDARVLNATLDLPGRLEAYYRAPIFARVSGYLKSWSADIGAQVKAGQVIAEIEAPDLDQQLLQARADLASQQSSAKLSEATLTRRRSLIASNFISMQEIDERTADFANKRAAVNSGQANVERPGNAGGLQEDHRAVRWHRHPAQHRRRCADLGRHRNRPGDVRDLRHQEAAGLCRRAQSYVPGIKIGAKAIITVPDYPNRTFRPPSRPRRRPSTWRRAPRGCSLRSTMPRASCCRAATPT